MLSAGYARVPAAVLEMLGITAYHIQPLCFICLLSFAAGCWHSSCSANGVYLHHPSPPPVAAAAAFNAQHHRLTTTSDGATV